MDLKVNYRHMEDKLSFDHLCMTSDEVDFVVYHDPCTDGLTAGFAAHKYLSEKFPDRKVTYFKASYDKPPPDVTGSNVVFLDFAYSLPIMEQLLKDANKLIILDHHKTAFEGLKSIPDKHKLIVMNHSGAYLSWRFFHGNDVPKLVLYVEDNDIWAKKLYKTEEVTAYLQSLPFKFSALEHLLDEKEFDIAMDKGETMVKQRNSMIDIALDGMVIRETRIGDKTYIVGYKNSTVLKSEIGNRALTKYPSIDFAAIYSIGDKDDSTSFSLRSCDDKTDVEVIAKILGGGGHRNASAVKFNYIATTLQKN